MRFDNIGYGGIDKEKYEIRKKQLRKEKNLKGDDIVDILLKKIRRDGLLTTTEKNVSGVNDSPFDLVAGDEKDLDLSGFEIKGDTDNFLRLKTQLQRYIFSFNKVYLVLHKKEVPGWMPDFVGILRVFENGDIIEERGSYMWDLLDVSTGYEWDTLFRENGLGISSVQTRNVLNILSEVRRNIVFNRFFWISSGLNTKRAEKFFPFSEEQKKVLIGFDVPYHYKQLQRDINQIENKLKTIKEVCKLGLQSSLKDIDDKLNESKESK